MKIKELLYCLGEAPISVYLMNERGAECVYMGPADEYEGENYYVLSGGLYAVDSKVIIEVEE